ncbi:hypothetical protein JHK82_055161 [Glycine max]|nr:hypothetical protein JHK85_055975 [Glycine max]KAG5073792.1 hypothetical protein JHK84_055023 [Glycine max]KAG5076466.1 hypothetical protein JHK82_055161 [Glycine max]
MVEGILYCYDYLGKIKGFNVGREVWEELKGLEKGLPRFEGSTQLMDEYFGKRAIDGVVVPRKGMGHASRDTTNARDRNAQKFVHGMIDGAQKITALNG